MSLNVYKKKKQRCTSRCCLAEAGERKNRNQDSPPKEVGAFSFHRKLRPMKQKMLRGMRTRAKKKHVASDRARRENVLRHILFQKQAKYLIFFVIFSFAIDVSYRKMV